MTPNSKMTNPLSLILSFLCIWRGLQRKKIKTCNNIDFDGGFPPLTKIQSKIGSNTCVCSKNLCTCFTVTGITAVFWLESWLESFLYSFSSTQESASCSRIMICRQHVGFYQNSINKNHYSRCTLVVRFPDNYRSCQT